MNFKEIFKKVSLWFLTRPNITGFVIFLIMIGLMSFVVKLRYEVVKENEHREMSNIINVVRQNFEQILKNSYNTTLTLAMTINDNGEPENFEKIAAQLVTKNASIDAVQLVPNGVIKYVYPYEENKLALNYDILNTTGLKEEAEKSIKSRLIFFAGPLQLKQGGTAVVGRLPVFKDNRFWGFSAVIIKIETLLRDSGIQAVDDTKYYFQFSKINPVTQKEEFFLPNKIDLKKQYYQTVMIPEGEWKLYLINRNNNILDQLYTSTILGLLLCVISALWITTILKKPAKLQILIEQQTKKIIKREAEFRAIFNQAPVGIAKLNTKTGQFINVNKEYARIVGYTEDELLATDFQSITHPDDLAEDLRNMDNLKKGLTSEFCMEKRYLHKSGQIVWVNLIVSILGKTDDDLIENHIAIVEDITDKKRAEEELKQSFELVSEQNKRLLNFSFIVSHNLRSHTSNIELISNLLEGVKSKEEQDEMVDLLKQVSKSLDETLRNLNEVVNIRTNINLTIERLNLSHYIEKSKTLLNQQIIDKEAIVKNLVPGFVEIDYNAAYLESIVYNFMSNAIRYSHPKRNPIVTISYNETEKALIIADNGIGIDLKRYGDNLFGMYKTFNNNPDAKGIGLFITKNQIDAMGGKIKTESTINEGTTFTIYFK